MAKRYQSVHEIKEARLYHYERFCPAWLETVLRSRKIFCSDPSKLNDPWDCKPWFRSDPHSVSPDGLSVSVQAEIAKRRIYCLSPNPANSLMWSHYAQNHQGICLEFHVGNRLFLKAKPVNYEAKYPAIKTDELLTEGTVEKALLTKDVCWDYEDEFRLLASPFLPEDSPLKLRDGYLQLPARTLVSVIVGCNGDYDTVATLVMKHMPELRVQRATRTPDNYKLNIVGKRQNL